MRTTFLIQALVVFFIAAGFFLLTRDLLEDLEFESFQAAEAVMVDTANILAAGLEEDTEDAAGTDTTQLAAAMERAGRRRLDAMIFKLRKTQVSLSVYVTDKRGVVVYDSEGGNGVGQDLSGIRDVALTLAGRYGARSTRTDPADPATSVLHVAAPIRCGDQVIGVLTVRKPQANFRPFIEDRVRRILWSAGLIGSGVMILAAGVFFWLLRPIRRLTAYAQAIERGDRVPLPPLGQGREAVTLGRALEGMRRELEGRAYAERYVRTLTHELKSPLAAIRGAAELLQEDPPAEDKEKFTANILQEADRSESIIRQLLELSKLEGRPSLANAGPVDLAALVCESVAASRPRLDAAQLVLSLAVPDAAVPARGDPMALRTALSNLIENAADFSPPGGVVTVRLARDGGEAVIEVDDDGPGVPDYALDKVFDHFYSLRHLHTGRKGSGLGLTFVREAAHLHHGSATLANRPGGGCRATFRIPAGEG